MVINYMSIENFGIFDKKKEIIFQSAPIKLIVGENGSGKSTILFLLNFLLDSKTRKAGLKEEWINVKNRKEGIVSTVIFKFSVKDIEILNSLAIVDNDYIYIKMEVVFEDGEYIPYFYFGEIEKLKFKYYESFPFDNFINILYLKENMFEENGIALIKTHIYEQTNKEEVLEKINNSIKKSNDEISGINEIMEISQITQESISDIFEENDFGIKISSNIKFSNKFNTLKFQSIINENDESIFTHGSGFEKIFSLITLIKTLKYNNKKIIILWDEPENNLFFTYQKKIIQIIRENEKIVICSIITTHSPNIVELLPNISIIKIYKNEIRSFYITPKNCFFTYQVDLSKHIFYDFVVLVEGHSEKMFFEYITKENEYVKSAINGRSVSFLNVQGTHFEGIYPFLKELCIKIFILTDNDVYKNKLQGYLRIAKLLKDNEEIKKLEIDDFNALLKVNDNNIVEITHDQKDICKKIKEIANLENIYISSDWNQGFEYELKNDQLIDESELKELQNYKLKNLSKKLEEINKNLSSKTIEDSNYLFRWIRNLKWEK